MHHSQFDIESWNARFTDFEFREPEMITSPGQLCRNEQLRVSRSIDENWGDGVPTDVFVWANGPPPKPYLTKIGGTPYRPAAEEWPCDRQGNPWGFLGQICFADSLDITGKLPGDVLLIFLDPHESYRFEWRDIGLVFEGERYVPEPFGSLAPRHGFIARTVAYPEYDTETEWTNRHENACLLARYQATQIGSAPHFVQSRVDLPGRLIATLNSIQPASDEPWPWVNQEQPHEAEAYGREDLMIGDMGCLYISIDDDGKAHSEEAYH